MKRWLSALMLLCTLVLSNAAVAQQYVVLCAPPSVATLQPCTPSQTVTGTISTTNPTGTVSINVAGQGSIGLTIQGTFSGTVVLEGSIDGTNFTALNCQLPGNGGSTGGVNTGTFTAPISPCQTNIAGMSVVRMRGTAMASGTATITFVSALAGIAGATAVPVETVGTALNVVGASPGVLASGSGNAGYPSSSTPVVNAATGTTGAVVATLPASASGQYTYLCNLQISAAGSATISPITIAGVQGGSWIVQGISAGGAPFAPPPWTPCLRSSAVNTAITITTTADASASAVDVQASGYQQ